MKRYAGRAFLRVWWRTMGGERLVGFARDVAICLVVLTFFLGAVVLVLGVALVCGASVYWLAGGLGAPSWLATTLTLGAFGGSGYAAGQSFRVLLYSDRIEEERQKILEQKGEDGSIVKGALTMESPHE